QELTIHTTIHPVLHVERDAAGRLRKVLPRADRSGIAESYIRLEIDREPNRQQHKLLEHEFGQVLADVRVAVREWLRMQKKMLEARASMDNGPAGADEALRQESKALLEWMAEDHFTFLGYREYRVDRRNGRFFLKAVSGTGLGLLSREERGGREVALGKDLLRHTRRKDWLIITKANSRSTVHRPSYLDYVGVKLFDEDGVAVGEKRFIGLFTSIAYSENPRNIPLLRLKVQ